MGPLNMLHSGKDGRGVAGGGGSRGDWDAGGISISEPCDCWLLDQRPDTILRLPGFYKLWQEERGGHGSCAPSGMLRGN